MQEIFVGGSLNYTAPAGTTNVLVLHEWGDAEVAFAAASAGAWTYTPTSIGVYTTYFVKSLLFSSTNNAQLAQVYPNYVNHPVLKVIGSQLTLNINTVSGSSLSTGTYTATVLSRQVTLISPQLVNSSTFFNDYSTLDTDNNEAGFGTVERLIRTYIHRHCQQQFGPYLNKSRVIQGEGESDLPLPFPMLSIFNVWDNFGNDLTAYCDFDFVSPWFIHHQPEVLFLDASTDVGYVNRKQDVSYRGHHQFFSKKLNFTVLGDWGFYDVPSDVQQAAELLIADTFTGQSALVRAGIRSAQLGDYSFTISPGMEGSTGNLLADDLLSNYMLINIAMV